MRAPSEEGGGGPLQIRQATAMDGREVARIQIETWRASYAGLLSKDYLIRLSLEERSAWWREAIARHREGRTFVALGPTEGSLVGFGTCGPARRESFGLQGEVYSLYVDLDWQNRGVGRRLLTRLFEELAAQGYGSAMIRVLAANPARYFYEAMGGEPVGEGHEYFGGLKLAILAYGWRDLQGWLAKAQRRS